MAKLGVVVVLLSVALSRHLLHAKKSVLDYDDGDIEKLSRQWEVNLK